MKFRLVLLFFASVVVASVASAQSCLRCVSPSGVAGTAGTCQPSGNNECTAGCCDNVVGAACTVRTNGLICIPDRVAYFTSRMPQQVEGSTVRLRLAPAAKAPSLKCAAGA